MGYRRTPFALGEWYHCFSRGIDKRIVFSAKEDFQRFEQLLYLANDTKPINRALIRNLPHEEIFELPRTQPLVAIGAYALMRNHPHLLIQEKTENGISRFMHKVGTGYTMYFNLKYRRIGNLLVKPFRSKCIGDDDYLRHVAQYIHLNPAEIFEPSWKQGKVKDIRRLEQNLLKYEHSSLPDYFGEKRPECAILDEEAMDIIRDGLPTLASILQETKEYYVEIAREFGIPRRRL